MENDILGMERKLLNRNKWTYSLGGIGRDMIYQLVATFFIVYIQYALNLSAEQFSVVGIILVIGRVWDGINDPIMGGIVDNTRSKWGKFKPWILTGAILTGIAVILMFNFRPVGGWNAENGWNFVIFFGVIYFFWEIAFTLNDIPYWSLLPNLAKDKKNRDQIAMLVVVFAAVGAFLGNGIVSFTTVGNALRGYSVISIIFVMIFLACTFLTVFGVKEPRVKAPEKEEKVSIRQMFGAIKNNDQLLWSALALLLYTVGSGLLVALGYNFFYMELGYDGSLVLIFVVTFGVSTILIQSLYSQIAKKIKRRFLMRLSIFILFAGYLLMLIMGYLPFIPVNIITVCVFGALVFGGQAIFYMITIINMTNTIEYNEFKTGSRNEAVLFSLRPFVTKLASAFQQGIVTLVLVASGIYILSQNVSQLETLKNVYDNLSVTEQTEFESNATNRVVILDDYELTAEERTAIYDALQEVEYLDEDNDGIKELFINDAADSAFRDQITGSMRISMRLSITILPIMLILGAYIIFRKKYIITEEYYENMLVTINKRIEAEQTTQVADDSL